MTRRHYIELIQRALSGGMISDDSDLTFGLVNMYFNSACGFAIKANYKDEIQLNGTENVSDSWYAEYTGLVITLDSSTGRYITTLPQQPAGIGAGWDISEFMLITGSGAKLFAYPITAREVQFLYQGNAPFNEIFYLPSGVNVMLHSCKDITRYTANIRMIASQSSDLDAPMNVPDTYLPMIIDYIMKALSIEMQMPIDNSSDGVPTPQVKS